MEAQVQNAVEVALNPQVDHNLKQQALDFISQIRESSDGWRLALGLLMNQPVRPAPVRHFALQMLDSAIKRGYLNDISAFEQTKAVFLSLLSPNMSNQQYVVLRDEPTYLQKQVAHSLTLLFLLSYTTTWTNFFGDFATSVRKNAKEGKGLDSFTALMFLRVLSIIDEEVADVIYSSAKRDKNQQLNTEIKDRIRAYDVANIFRLVLEIMVAFENDPTQEDLITQCLQVVGQWIAWIDITLIVNDAYLTLIYRFLTRPGLRRAAADALSSIVSKKMGPADKLDLITFLNVTDVLSSLSQDEDSDFTESVARLVNAQGLELTRIISETTSTSPLGAKALKVLRDLLPHLLRFLSDEYDETSSAVFPFLAEILALARRSTRNQDFFIVDLAFLRALLEALFKKLKYDDEMQDADHEDSELETDFLDLRKRILSFQDTIAVLHASLYSDSVYEFVTQIFTKFASGSSNGWQDIEVALFLLRAFAEPLKRNGLWDNSAHLHRFANMLSQAINLAPKLTHPMVRILFMDILVRYSTEVQLQSNLIHSVLEFFVGQFGIHSPELRVQFRAWYLFDRLLSKFQKDIAPISEQILSTFTDLLVIRPPMILDTSFESIDSDSENESDRDVFFDNQLYLFQSAGLLTALSHSSNFEIGQALIRALEGTINENLQGSRLNQQGAHYVHHSVMAIGDMAKGFDNAADVSSGSRQQTGTRFFYPASETVLKALSVYEDFSQIRDATRYAFSRFVAVMGEGVLDKIPALIGGLLGKSTTGELIDFLPFLGQLIHKFKPNIQEFLNELMLPLLSRIFQSLSKPVQGTDDIIEQTNMRKAYLAFILNLLNNRMEDIFVSEVNRSKFEAVLESILQYAMDTSDASVEKLAFSVLNKMVVAWTPTGSPATDAGFQEAFDRFVIEHLSRICFDVPSKATFNSSDAQARLVLAEIAALQKSIYLMKGDSFCAYLDNTLFPSLSVPPTTGHTYIQALQRMDLKQFKKYFMNFASK